MEKLSRYKGGKVSPSIDLWKRSVKGFTIKDWDELLTRFRKRRVLGGGISLDGVDRKVRQEFGKIRRYRREYNKSVKMINHYTELRDKYLPMLEEFQGRYERILSFMNPKVSLKRPTKSLRSWRGKVWWGVGKGKEKGWVEFYIISDKKRLKKGLTEDDIRKLGQDIFKSKLMERDILDIIDG